MRKPPMRAFVALLALSVGALADESPRAAAPKEVAARFAEAYRAGDGEAAGNLAASRTDDPFLIADVFLGEYVGAVSRGATSLALDTAAAYAAAVRRERRGIDISPFVAAWRAADRPAEGDLAADVPSVTAITLEVARATAEGGLGKQDDAARTWSEVARRSAEIGWDTERAPALSTVGYYAYVRSDLRAAEAAWQAALELADSIGAEEQAADVRRNLALARGALSGPAAARPLVLQAITAYERLGLRAKAASARTGLADLESQEGAYAAAEADYRLAIEALEALGRREDLAHALGGAGWVAQRLGRFGEAQADYERGIREAEASGAAAQAALLRAGLGWVLDQVGKHEAAYDLLSRALREYEGVAPEVWKAWALRDLGTVAFHLGRTDEALHDYEQALAAAQGVGARSEAAGIRMNLGVLFRKLGRYAEALEAYEAALAEEEALGDRPTMAMTLGNIGGLHYRLGAYEKALEYHQRQLRMLEDLGDVLGARRARTLVADTYDHLGRSEEALSEYRSILESERAAGDMLDAAGTLDDIGLALERLDRSAEARAAYEEALRDSRRLGDTVLEARVLSHLGGALVDDGNAEKGVRYLERALAVEEARGDRAEAASTLTMLAYGWRKMNQFDKALAAAGRAVDLNVAIVRGLSEEEATGRGEARTAADAGLAAVLVAAAADALPPDRRAVEAFRFAESGRALRLAEGIENRDRLLAAEVPAPLLAARADAQAAVAAAEGRLARLASDASTSPADLRVAHSDLDASYRRLEDAVSGVERAARRVATLAYPRVAALDEVRRSLPGGTALVEFAVGEGEASAIVADASGAALVDLGPAARLAEASERWLEAVASGSAEEPAAAAALYDLAWRPLESLFPTDGRVLVSPDGPLAFVPMDALLRADGGRRERAIERWEIAYVPSGTVHLALLGDAEKLEKGRGVLALGDPIYPSESDSGPAASRVRRESDLRGLGDLPRLPATAAEASEIAEMYPDRGRTVLVREGATVSALLRALADTHGRLQAVHLACHGYVDARRPRLTGLVLGGGDVLSLDRIYETRIPADLAVLSACETARGKELAGEGVVGLVRGFLFAGTPRVVVSEWEVFDESTKRLMVDFHRRMTSEGTSASAALRAAKLAMLRAGGQDADPRRWAPFVLWGLATGP
jgi:CHAT domain-containing protein/tetratricopeptide (TPR) repeat protein